MPEYTARGAVISDDAQHRYWLLREWDNSLPHLTFVMLNPSTADADLDDPTIRRCVGFAKRDGYGGMEVVNLYAFRATNPKDLLTAADPVGPDNDQYLREVFANGSPVIAAWGANAKADRVRDVLAIAGVTPVLSLGVTKAGHPRHPLYIRGDQAFITYSTQPLSSAHSHPVPGDNPCMSETTPTATIVPFPVGTLVRAPDGVEFTVEEFVSEADSEDGNAFYWGSNNGGRNNVDHNHVGLTLVKTVEELSARQLPTKNELAEALADGLRDIGRSISLNVSEADYSDENGSVEFTGRTHDGLDIVFTVQITDVQAAQR